MLTGINGTIKLVGGGNDQKIQLIIPESDHEKFKEYKNIDTDGKVIEKEFCAGFMPDGKQLYVTGPYSKKEQVEGDVIMYINSVNRKNQGMKEELGLDQKKEEIQVKLFMNRAQVEYKMDELQTAKQQAEEALKAKTQELEAAKQQAEEALKAKTQELEAAKQQAEEALKTKTQELEAAKKQVETEKQALEAQLNNLKDEQQKVDTAIEGLFADGSIKTEIEDLINLTGEELKGKVKSLYDGKLKSTIEGIVGNNLSGMEDKKKLHEELQTKIESIIGTNQSKNVDEIVKLIKEELKNIIISASKFGKEVADLKKQLETKNTEVDKLNAELTAKETELTDLQTKFNTANKELEGQNAKVTQLTQKNKELEDQKSQVQQPKQSNAARYTAGIGMGLAAGLIAFTALERTVKLEMLVMVGIAVASALVVGGITYAVLPGTQVDEAEAQEVTENGKSK